MPKVRRMRSPSIDCSESYPYPSISKNLDLPRPNFGSADEMKEWDDTRCPICMEIPHNTVLLKCSSYEKGCRPYMCNTSYRHSNCLDQFCKSFDSHLSSAMLEAIPLTSTVSHDRKTQSEPGNPSQCGSKLQPKLICPLCRGGIYGYMVSEPARRYMNCKKRSCSSETCEFQGTYPELRKHARLVHPSVRPSEVDPSRQLDWFRMERERDFEDLFSSINASSDAGFSREGTLSPVILMSLVLHGMYSSEGNTDWIVSSDSRPRMPVQDRWSEAIHSIHMPATAMDVLSETVHRVSDDTQTNPSVEDDTDWIMSNLFSDSIPRIPLHDRRSETMHRVSNDTQTNQSARRSGLPSTHQPERNQRIHRAGWRNDLLSSNRPARWRSNRNARWRSSNSPSRMPHSQIVENYYYYRELSPRVRTSSTGMPRVSQVPHTNPRSNNSSSRRIPGRQLRWRNQRWPPFDSLP